MTARTGSASTVRRGARHERSKSLGEIVRLYDVVRSAHLERAIELAPSTFLYARENYDFDIDILSGHTGRVRLIKAPIFSSATRLFRHPPRVLEVNEPLARPAIRRAAAGVAAVKLRGLLGGPRARCVAYAIENLAPSSSVLPRRPRARVSYAVDQALSRFVARNLDRIVYGSAQASELYSTLRPPRTDASTKLIWALPVAARSASELTKKNEVLFVGAFTERKGILQLLDSWPLVAEAHPGWRLRLLGKGPLTDVVRAFAADRDDVSLDVDLPRTEIRSALADAPVLVLFSQPTRRWREQIGLPICEGLSFGCTIVSSTETGLADWLRQHRHTVVAPTAPVQGLAAAISSAIDHPVSVSEVLASLPPRDGRLAADDWLTA